jgi:signal peptidase II
MVERALRGILLLLVVALVGCDHATKNAAKAALEGVKPLALIPGLLDLEYTENRDTAFSLLRGVSGLAHPAKEWLLILGSSLALAALAVTWWKRRRRASLLEHAAFVAILGGAIGNVADRVARGYVVDFIHVHRWPVFNVADIAISVGVGLAGIAMLRKPAISRAPNLAALPTSRTRPVPPRSRPPSL